jgi:DnaJ domain
MQITPQSHNGSQLFRSQPSRFVDHMQQLFGEDPDPLFLEESWTLGVPAAIEKLNCRRKARVHNPNPSDNFSEDRAIRELEKMAALTGNVDDFLEDRAQPIDRRYSPAWLQPEAPEVIECRMSVGQASELLGVSHLATREGIRSAYRRKVGQCHPDRCQGASNAVRRRATQQLAALNEAYRLLCESLLHQVA